jgi:hypothetical protein
LVVAKKDGNRIFVFRADGRGKDARSIGSISVMSDGQEGDDVAGRDT